MTPVLCGLSITTGMLSGILCGLLFMVDIHARLTSFSESGSNLLWHAVPLFARYVLFGCCFVFSTLFLHVHNLTWLISFFTGQVLIAHMVNWRSS